MLRELLLHASLRPKYPTIAAKGLSAPIAQLLQACADPDVSPSAVIPCFIKDTTWQKILLESSQKGQDALDEQPEQAHRTYTDILLMLESKRMQQEWRQAMRQLRQAEQQGLATEQLVEHLRVLTRKRKMRAVNCVHPQEH